MRPISTGPAKSILPQDTAASSAGDLFSAFLNAPVTKLDADEYVASDLDGVTESLLGSGNMNFLMMQAGQTDDALSTANPFQTANAESLSSLSAINDGRGAQAPENTGINGSAADAYLPMNTAPIGTATGSNVTAGALSASTLAADSTSASALTDASFFASSASNVTGAEPSINGLNGNDGTNGANAAPGGNGNNGSNGADGSDGAGGNGGNTTIINNYYNTTNNNSIINNEGDILGGDILETIENIYNQTTNVTNDFLTTTVNNVTNILEEIIGGDGGGDGLGPIGVSLDATLDDLTSGVLTLINGENSVDIVNETIDLSPVTNLVTPLTGDILAGAGLDVLLNPLQYDPSAQDTDLTVGTDLNLLGQNIDLPPINIPLDAAEILLGDIDASLDLSDDLLDLPLLDGGARGGDTDLGLGALNPIADATPLENVAEILVNPVEDVIGDVDLSLDNLHINLLNLGQNEGGADSDVTVPLDIDLVDSDLLSNDLDITLDPVESLVGDIDLDLIAASDLLGSSADGLIDSGNGGADTPILSPLGDALSGTADALLPTGDSSIFADVTGDVFGVPVIDDSLILETGVVDSLLNDTLSGIEHTLDSAIGLLHDVPEHTGGLNLDALSCHVPGAADIPLWTETILPDPGALLGGGLADIGAIIPDIEAAGTATITLPVVPSLPALPSGGLFGGGGGHHGGLFG